MESIFERKFLKIYTVSKTYARQMKDGPFLEKNPF